MKRVKPRNKKEERVLAWCNRMRKKMLRKPVKTFAVGYVDDELNCVIAKTRNSA